MNKFAPPLLSAIIAAIVAYGITTFEKSSATTQKNDTVYAHVLKSGAIRCGFFEEAPFTFVDPNTGKKTGIAVELAEKAAEDLGLKIIWSEPISFANLTTDLSNGRYDAICGSLFNLPRGGTIDYTIPYAYVPVYAYTQAGRSDFDNKLDSLDWTKISIAGLDGEGSTIIAQKKLPQAHFVILPETMQIADMLTSLMDKKADIGFVMPTVFKKFDLNNSGKLQKIAADKPFYVFNVSFGVQANEPAFKNMLDFEMRNLATNGFLDGLFMKYDPDGLLFRPQNLYRPAQ